MHASGFDVLEEGISLVTEKIVSCDNALNIPRESLRRVIVETRVNVLLISKYRQEVENTTRSRFCFLINQFVCIQKSEDEHFRMFQLASQTFEK